jgi:endonuclease-8
MPEGDTVWLAAQRLRAALAGQVLLGSDFRVPQLATADLRGRRVLDVISRGKHLLTRFEPDLTLHTHFRMDGSWHLYRTGERWRGGPSWQVRVVLATEHWQAVGYRLPVVELLPTTAEHTAVGHLGPDLLGPDWDPDEAVRRLTADPQREIGVALLDQRNLAGVGNLYKTELCFLRGITPWTAVGDIDNLLALVRQAQRLLDLNRHAPEQVTTGDRRPGRRTWVFERAGKPCLRCGTRIAGADQGEPPFARGAYWCPSCQHGPAPGPAGTRGRWTTRPS